MIGAGTRQDLSTTEVLNLGTLYTLIGHLIDEQEHARGNDQWGKSEQLGDAIRLLLEAGRLMPGHGPDLAGIATVVVPARVAWCTEDERWRLTP